MGTSMIPMEWAIGALAVLALANFGWTMLNTRGLRGQLNDYAAYIHKLNKEIAVLEGKVNQWRQRYTQLYEQYVTRMGSSPPSSSSESEPKSSTDGTHRTS